MAMGKTKVNYLGREGLIQSKDAPDYGFVYESSLTKDPTYNLGDRVVLPDGREYIYAKAGVAITSAYLDYALYFAATMRSGWYVTGATAAKGDKEITMTLASATLDELRGGYIVLYKNGVANQTVRGIIGNTATSGTTATIYLDGALPHAIVSADGVELIANPWADVRPAFASASMTISMCGFGEVACAANSYIWVKVAGIHRVSQAAAPTNYERSVYFSTNGNTSHRGDVGTGVLDQRAGTLIIPGTDQSAFIHLQRTI
jgi:hypothetical protein